MIHPAELRHHWCVATLGPASSFVAKARASAKKRESGERRRRKGRQKMIKTGNKSWCCTYFPGPGTKQKRRCLRRRCRYTPPLLGSFLHLVLLRLTTKRNLSPPPRPTMYYVQTHTQRTNNHIPPILLHTQRKQQRQSEISSAAAAAAAMAAGERANKLCSLSGARRERLWLFALSLLLLSTFLLL